MDTGLREQIIHGLRSQGWSKIDAENEADERLARKKSPPPGPAKAPCGSCPYRRDVPPGVWVEHEYLKLPDYDGETGEQALKGAVGLFYCHQRTGNLCAGWVGCHDMEHNLAVRFAERGGNGVAPETYDYESPVPLFGSGAEAAAHGLSGVENPGPEARRLVAKLAKKLGLD